MNKKLQQALSKMIKFQAELIISYLYMNLTILPISLLLRVKVMDIIHKEEGTERFSDRDKRDSV